ELVPFEHPRIQPLANQTQQHSITYPSAKDRLQVSMVEGVEELPDIDLHDPSASHFRRRRPEVFECLVCGTPRPEAIREAVERLLVHRFENHRNRTLQHLVLEGGDADGTCFHAIALRDVYPPPRRRTICPGLRTVEEQPEVTLQLLRVRLRSDSVDSRGAVLSRSAVCLSYPVRVDVVGQRRQRNAGLL